MIKHPNNMLQHLENIVLHGTGIAGVCALLMGAQKKTEARQKRSKPRRNKQRRTK